MLAKVVGSNGHKWQGRTLTKRSVGGNRIVNGLAKAQSIALLLSFIILKTFTITKSLTKFIKLRHNQVFTILSSIKWLIYSLIFTILYNTNLQLLNWLIKLSKIVYHS